jgi:hypothetical protein
VCGFHHSVKFGVKDLRLCSEVIAGFVDDFSSSGGMNSCTGFPFDEGAVRVEADLVGVGVGGEVFVFYFFFFFILFIPQASLRLMA